ARARFADDGDGRAGADPEIRALDRGDDTGGRVELDGEVLDAQKVWRGRRRGWGRILHGSIPAMRMPSEARLVVVATLSSRWRAAAARAARSTTAAKPSMRLSRLRRVPPPRRTSCIQPPLPSRRVAK